LEVSDRQIAAYIVSRTFGLEDDVVTFRIQVRYVHLWAVHLEFWCPTPTGIFSAPMREEICYWLRNGLRIKVVVDAVYQPAAQRRMNSELEVGQKPVVADQYKAEGHLM